MTLKYKLSQIKVDTVDHLQPLGRYLILLFRAFERDLMKKLNEVGFKDLVVSDLQIIRFVHPDGSTAVSVAKLAGITKQAVGKSVDSLITRGYLRRKKSETDGRSKILIFTAKGTRLLHNIVRIIFKIEQNYIETLGEAKFDQIKDNLAVLIQQHPMEEL